MTKFFIYLFLCSLPTFAFAQKAQPIKTAKVTITGFDCGDYCHLEYKTASNKKGSKICNRGVLCDGLRNAHEKNTPKIYNGKKVIISYRKFFVPEGGEWMDEIIATKIVK